jgi:hypothetical protein
MYNQKRYEELEAKFWMYKCFEAEEIIEYENLIQEKYKFLDQTSKVSV